MSDDLLPCPFCGGKARMKLEEHDFNGHEVECNVCCASSAHFYSYYKAAAAWNTRNTRAQLSAQSPIAWRRAAWPKEDEIVGDWIYTDVEPTEELAWEALYSSQVTSAQSPADGDGWIQWWGGSNPVTESARVTVKYRYSKYRNGQETACAGCFIWQQSNNGSDIIAYRIAK